MNAVPVQGAMRLHRTIEEVASSGEVALAVFITGGFPTPDSFGSVLAAAAGEADIVEVGIPFTDPMADGVTIQESSRIALEAGVSVKWIVEELKRTSCNTPLVIMSYLNPLLACGIEQLARSVAEAGVCGLIIPDLPYEECSEIRGSLNRAGVALVQMVTPLTPQERLSNLCGASQGFVYAVTTTGTTGGNVTANGSIEAYLDRVREVSEIPVLAGFGIRSANQVRSLVGHADGAIVGSAFIEVTKRGEDAAAFLRDLRTK